MVCLLFINFSFAQSTSNLLKKNYSPNHKGFFLNKGQITDSLGNAASNVFLSSSQNGLQIFITNKGITYILSKQNKNTHIDSLVRFDVELLNATILSSQIELTEIENDAPTIYYLPTVPNGLFENYAYKKIKIKNIYPGVDWIWNISDSTTEYSFELQSGVNPDIIKLKYIGFDDVKIDESGDLILANKLASFEETKLKSWQNNQELKTKFNIISANTISYFVNNYAVNSKLIIDPTLVWSTNFGGYNANENAVTTNKLNDFFVAGQTYGNANFPLLGAGSYFTWSGINSNYAFVSKFNANLRLKWSLIYGGSGNDYATGIKADNLNNIFIVGNTNSENFPVKNIALSYYDSILNDTSSFNFEDAFLVKFNSNGVRQFATYLGGAANDYATDIDVDNVGNAIVTGYTYSTDFPLKTNGTFNQNALVGITDGFISKFNNSGAMLWSSYFGGNKDDKINSVSVDNSFNIFITGLTNSASLFPLQNTGTYYDGILDSTDFFISKFSNNNTLLWSTYFGGSKVDYGTSTEIDNNGNLFVAGNTNSANAPVYRANQNVYFDSLLNNGVPNLFYTNYEDVLIAKFSNTGNRIWATYLGGSKDEDIAVATYSQNFINKNNQLTIDNCNNLYVDFYTASDDDTLINLGCNSYYDNTFSSIKILKFSNNLNLKWATYFGNGGFGNLSGCIAVNKKSDLYLTSTTTILPTAFSTPFSYYNNTGDIVLSRFDYPLYNAGVTYSLCGSGCTGTAAVVVNASCMQQSFQYLWSNGNSTSTISNLCAGNYYVIVKDTGLTCTSDTVHFNLHSGFQMYPQVSALACPTTCNGVASVNIPNLNTTGFQYQWHVNDTIINNIPLVLDLCPQQDTLIIHTPTCGSDTTIFNIQPYPYLMLYKKWQTTGNLIQCPLQCNSAALFLAIGGQKSATINWSNGITGQLATNLCAGNTYTITATDSVCYFTSAKVTIPNSYPPFPSINPSFTAPTCKPIYTVQAYLNFGGHQQPYHYLWNTGDTTSTVDSLYAGTYTCVISDSCTTFPSVSITIFPFVKKPFIVNIILPQGTCDSVVCNGEMGVYIQPINNFWGIAPYQYYWNGVLGTAQYDSACIGKKYRLMVIDACGDTARDSVTFNLIQVGGNTVLFSHLRCNDSCHYNAFASSSGIGPFSYLWFDSTTLTSHTNLCKDSSYWVIVTNGCGKRDTVNFSPAVPPINISVSFLGYTACCKGTMHANPSGGLPPYHYLWSNGSTSSHIDTSVCNGSNYWLIATDSCGNKDTINFITPAIYPPSFVVYLTTNPSCNNLCTGSATVSLGPTAPNLPTGVPPFSYIWSNGIHSVTTVYNLCKGQVIHCNVIDQCGTLIGSVTTVPLASSLALNMGSSPSCIGTCNGIAYAYATNGAPPYTYIWNDTVIGTNSYYQACAGQTYKCKIIDACGDSAIDTITIPILQPLTANVFLSNTKCNFNCTAQAFVSHNGGLAPYFVAWSTGLLNTNTLTNLCADSTYNVVVSSLGCAAKRVKFHVPNNPILKLIKVFDDSTCANSCTGKIKVTGINGQLPYNYNWSNGATSQLITNLCAGIYTCIVTDFCNKKDTILDTIYAHTPLHGFIVNNKKSCSNICNGTAKISQYGGAPPYTYLWSNSQTTQQATNLCKGSNYCVVHDSCGYQDTVKFVTQTFALLKDSLVITKKISCLSSCNGAAKVITKLGKAPYTFLWSNGNTSSSTATLCAGNNFCIITDSCGLKDTLSFKIDSISRIKIDSIHFSNSSCNNVCTGSASVFVSGGQLPLAYLWSNGATTSAISNICPGIYSVIITNPNCLIDSLFDTVKIISNFDVIASVISNSPCFDSCKGIAKVIANGGTSPYNYLWSNGATSSTFNKFCADTFIIKVTDNVGCIAFDTIVITQPKPIVINSIFTNSHCYNKDGKIELQVVGGTNPFSYAWSNGANSIINNNIAEGNYQVIIEDSSHCKISESFTLHGIYPNVYVSHDTLVGGGDTVILNAYGTKYFNWFPSSNLNCDTCKNPYWIGIEQQSICVIGIDTFGCSDTACLVISTFDNCGNIVLPKAFSPNNDGINDVFKPLAHYPDCFIELDFKIFDRWGVLIFQTNTIANGWDGKYKGEPEPQDAYVWTLEAKNYFGRKIILKGNVTLIK